MKMKAFEVDVDRHCALAADRRGAGRRRRTCSRSSRRPSRRPRSIRRRSARTPGSRRPNSASRAR